MSAAEDRSTIELADEHLIGRTGLIRTVRQILSEPGEPRLYGASAVVASVGTYLGVDVEGHTGAVGFTREEALAGSIGECVERYCCAYYNWDELVLASKEELGEEAIGMDELRIFSQEQVQRPEFPFVRWSPDLRIHWAEGKSLITGERRYLPASLVYIPYRPRDPAAPSDFLGLSVSSGQACHTVPARAVLSGLLEVIERDAFMLTWLRRLGVPRVDIHGDPYLAEVYDRYFGGTTVRFQVFDTTLDFGIPSMISIAESDSERGPFIAIGSACRVSERQAVVKALMESAQGMTWARDLLRRRSDWRPTPDFLNVRGFEDHVRLYCEPDMKRHADFLLASPPVRAVTEPEREFAGDREMLHHCLERVESLGYDVILVDTTTPELAELGFYVPKIFIPGTVPLTAVHGLPALGSPRFDEVPERMGYTEPQNREFNPIPHPFP